MLREVLGQQRNIFAALAQRRQLQGENHDPVVQIFAEFALLHRFFQIAMGGYDHPHVYPQRFVAANALHFAFFHNAQQLSLHRRRHIADFIQK